MMLNYFLRTEKKQKHNKNATNAQQNATETQQKYNKSTTKTQQKQTALSYCEGFCFICSRFCAALKILFVIVFVLFAAPSVLL